MCAIATGKRQCVEHSCGQVGADSRVRAMYTRAHVYTRENRRRAYL